MVNTPIWKAPPRLRYANTKVATRTSVFHECGESRMFAVSEKQNDTQDIKSTKWRMYELLNCVIIDLVP